LETLTATGKWVEAEREEVVNTLSKIPKLSKKERLASSNGEKRAP